MLQPAKPVFLLTAAALALGLSGCAGSGAVSAPQAKPAMQAVQPQPAAQEATPPTSYGDGGPVFANAQGKPVLRVLSDGPGEITLKHLASGRIHYLKQVPAASGAKYQDADGYILWSKGKEAMFGKGERILFPSLKLQKN